MRSRRSDLPLAFVRWQVLLSQKQVSSLLQKNSVVGVEGGGEEFGGVFANGALVVFHFGDMTLGDAGLFGKLALG